MRDRLPYLISLSALAVALLGATPVGEAAKGLVIPKTSVGAAQLKKGAVTTPKLANNAVSPAKLKKSAVTTLKVLDGSLLAADFAPNQLPAGQKGDKGDKGDRGDRGDKGEKGDPGLSGLQVVTKAVTLPANSTGGGVASCPSGKRVIAGGGLGGGSFVYMNSSYPGVAGTEWVTRWRNTVGNAANVTIYAFCAIVA